jgi:hypothetical protein
MTVEQLRAGGFTTEADRLEREVRQHATWTARPVSEVSSRAIALSLFGSRRFDELAEALGLTPFGERP